MKDDNFGAAIANGELYLTFSGFSPRTFLAILWTMITKKKIVFAIYKDTTKLLKDYLNTELKES